MTIDYKQNGYYILTRIYEDLEKLVARESAKPYEYMDLTVSTLSLLEEEILPMLKEELDYQDDPGDCDGEPPITAAEMHSAAWQEHQEAHR